MAKGMFSQGVCLLTNGQANITDVRSELEHAGFEIVKQTTAQGDWWFGGDTLVVPFLPEVNGYAAIDVVNQPWPDTMGDPKKQPMLFGAWAMGHFGPLTFPGSLARAQQHAWSWEPGKTVANDHRGFIRIRLSYAFGAADNDPILPPNYDPLGEMMFLSRVTLALLKMPGVICYFNPNGEVLRDAAGFENEWTACEREEKLPLGLWINIRFFNLSENLLFMDTVGNGQLDFRDVESIFPAADYDPSDIDYYLRNVTHYLLDLDREINTGEPIDGPGERGLSWTTEVLDESLSPPPRRVLRLYPQAMQHSIREALATVGRTSG